jgi:hypothetical protein
MLIPCPIRDSVLDDDDAPREFSDHEPNEDLARSLVLLSRGALTADPLGASLSDTQSLVEVEPEELGLVFAPARGVNYRHRLHSDAIVWKRPELFRDQIPGPDARKVAVKKLRVITRLNWKQSFTSKRPPSVTLRCATHANCRALARVRTEGDPEHAIIEFSNEPHTEEVALVPVRGIPAHIREYVDQSLIACNGQPGLVRKRILADIWDGTPDGMRDVPSKLAISRRHTYNNSIQMVDRSQVVTVQDCQNLFDSLRCPSTAEEIEALPPTQAYIIGFEWDPHYGAVFVVTNNAIGTNLLHEFNSHHASGEPCLF